MNKGHFSSSSCHRQIIAFLKTFCCEYQGWNRKKCPTLLKRFTKDWKTEDLYAWVWKGAWSSRSHLYQAVTWNEKGSYWRGQILEWQVSLIILRTCPRIRQGAWKRDSRSQFSSSSSCLFPVGEHVLFPSCNLRADKTRLHADSLTRWHLVSIGTGARFRVLSIGKFGRWRNTAHFPASIFSPKYTHMHHEIQPQVDTYRACSFHCVSVRIICWWKHFSTSRLTKHPVCLNNESLLSLLKRLLFLLQMYQQSFHHLLERNLRKIVV